jgi:hypothetical protein
MKSSSSSVGPAEFYVTADELGAHLHIHPDTIRGWVATHGDLPHIKLPNHSLRFRISEVEAWLEKFKQKVA